MLRCVVKDRSNVLYRHAGELFVDFCDVQSRFEVANDGVRRDPETVDVGRTMKLERITLDDRASGPCLRVSRACTTRLGRVWMGPKGRPLQFSWGE